jgi:hypothetical protein
VAGGQPVKAAKYDGQRTRPGAAMTLADFLEKHLDGVQALIVLCVVLLFGWMLNHD